MPPSFTRVLVGGYYHPSRIDGHEPWREAVEGSRHGVPCYTEVQSLERQAMACSTTQGITLMRTVVGCVAERRIR